MLTSTQIREQFLAFFAKHGHERVASSPLVPGDDPTLMFTNAGMVQFKDVFLGFDKRPYTRAATAQRCLRAGGKHNDLENVGYTARHHTFFEMLGNFSFGEYFKENAIALAWELLTSPTDAGGYGLKKEHLWVTVFGGGKLFGEDSEAVPADEDAYQLWHKTLVTAGFSEAEATKRITKVPTTDNFWMMGDTGPCGPCSEIFYNRDPQATEFEGEDEAKADVCVEIWNLVFMQYNRDTEGNLNNLPAPCVDTGMGLERLSAVLQEKDSNYETDLFAQLIQATQQAIETAGGKVEQKSASLRVIADHIRAAAYLVADRVLPSNEGRGYVLRRIIRRALRHGYQLQTTKPFFASLVEPLAKLMGDAHPELPAQIDRVTKVLAREEERFTKTLSEGMRILIKEVSSSNKIDGATAFKLYDTYGFPLDLTDSYAREHNLTVDHQGFEHELAKQKERSRAASGFKADIQAVSYAGPPTKFSYDKEQEQGSVIALYDEHGKQVEVLADGSPGLVVLDQTCFYAEAGGQVGDQGHLHSDNCEANVLTTQKLRQDVHGHEVHVTGGEISVGDTLTTAIDTVKRTAIKRAHSATHLLHEALRRRLGDHVEQRGSLVEADRLRFDFAHDGQLTDEDLQEVANNINHQVLADAEVIIDTEVPYQEALQRGARALFGEKYGEYVRVVQIDADYSIELCGGTHVKHASQIGLVHLENETAIAAGIRRIEARTGLAASSTVRDYATATNTIAQLLKIAPTQSASRVEELVSELNSLRAKVTKLEEGGIQAAVAKWCKDIQKGNEQLPPELSNITQSQVIQVGPAFIFDLEVQHLDGKLNNLITATAAENLKPAAVITLTHNQKDDCLLAVNMSKNLQTNLSAIDLFGTCTKELSKVKGGGSKTQCQGGGSATAKQRQAAIEAVTQLVKEKLA